MTELRTRMTEDLRLRNYSPNTILVYNNEEHRHSGIELLTPSMVHYGQAGAVIERRQVVLDAAYQAHPERFVRSAPKSLGVPKEVWINRPPENKTQ